jgi:hypothetical protein
MSTTHFLYWALELNLKPLDTLILPFFLKMFSLFVNKGPIQSSICFKFIPGLLVVGPVSKVALSSTLLDYYTSCKMQCTNHLIIVGGDALKIP